MSKKYAIFDHFNETTLEHAAAQTYHRSAYPQSPRVDDYGYCPVGRCMEADGLEREPTPSPYAVALRLAGDGDEGTYRRIYRQMERFSRRWDRGEIVDLRAAMGLPKATS
jgi:hypothetical protein